MDDVAAAPSPVASPPPSAAASTPAGSPAWGDAPVSPAAPPSPSEPVGTPGAQTSNPPSSAQSPVHAARTASEHALRSPEPTSPSAVDVEGALQVVPSTGRNSCAHFGARKRRQILKASRDNAINNIALRTLLQAKREPIQPHHTTSLVPAEMFGASVRSLQMLSYMKQTTQQVFNTHLDMSNASIANGDLAVLRSVLSTHPNITSIDFTGAQLTTQGMKDVVKLAEANPALCVVQWADGPAWAVAAVEEKLQKNRKEAAAVAQLREKAARRRSSKKHKVHLGRLIARLLSEELQARKACASEEERAREGGRQYLAQGVRRIIRASERRRVREARAAAMQQTVNEEYMQRLDVWGEEEREIRVIFEMQEYAQRREHQSWVQTEVLRLKRLELTSWSEHKRAERGRKQKELDARVALEEELMATREDVVIQSFNDSLADLAAAEVASREEALERQNEREDREMRAILWKEKMAKEALERELWLKKQAELELEMKRTQLQKHRDAMAREEHKARMVIVHEHEQLIETKLHLNEVDAQVSRGLEKVRQLEQERRDLGNLSPGLSLTLGGRNIFFLGEQYPVCPVQTAAVSIALEKDFAAKVKDMNKRIKAAHEELKRTVDHANRECHKESSRNEATFVSTLRKLLNASGAASAFDETANLALAHECSEGTLAGVVAAVAVVAGAAPPPPESVTTPDKGKAKAPKKTNKLKDAVKANRAQAEPSYRVYKVPPLTTNFDMDPAALHDAKLQVIRGTITVRVEGRLAECGEQVYVEPGGVVQKWVVKEPPSESPKNMDNYIPIPDVCLDTSVASVGSADLTPSGTPATTHHLTPQMGPGSTMMATLASAKSIQKMEKKCASAASGVRMANLKQLHAELGGKSPAVLMRAKTMEEFLVEDEGSVVDDESIVDAEHPLEGVPAEDPLVYAIDVTSPDDIANALKHIFYRVGCPPAQISIGAPAARTVCYELRLEHAGNMPADPHVFSTAEGSVTVLIAKPLVYFSAGCGEPMEYVEDCHPDTCKPLHDVVVDEPGRIVVSGANVSQMSTSYHNHTLRLEFTGGYSAEDCLLYAFSEGLYLRETDRKDILRSLSDFGPEGLKIQPPPPTTDHTWCICYEDKEVAHYPVIIGEVVKGHMLVVGRTPYNPPKGNCIEIRLYTSLVTPEVLAKVLRRIRFANFSQDPEEGRRYLDCSVIDTDGNASSACARIDVVATDDATTMTLREQKVNYRCITYPSAPKATQRLLAKQYVRPFLGVQVEDVDTTTFVGGYCESLLEGSHKGDVLFFAAPVAATHAESEELGTKLHVLDLGVSRRRIVYEGRVVATLVHGITVDAAHDRGAFDEALASSNAQNEQLTGGQLDRVSWLWCEEGGAAIAACGPLLEALCFASSQLRPATGDRRISVCLQVGASFDPAKDTLKSALAQDLDTPLEDTVTVKMLPEYFAVSEPHQVYREGSGYVRIAPFEVTTNLEHSFTGGSLLVEVIEGAGPTDFLGVKDSGDLRFATVAEVAVPVEKIESVQLGRIVSMVAPAAAAAPVKTGGNKLKAMGNRVMAVSRMAGGDKVENSLSTSMADSVRSVMGGKNATQKPLMPAKSAVGAAMHNPVSPADIPDAVKDGSVMWLEVFSGAAHVGFMRLGQHEAFLYMQGANMKKKDVTAVMRCMTYTNTALNFDDQETHKYLRVRVGDGGQARSEAIIHIEVQEVDDVTEVCLARKRVCLQQGGVHHIEQRPFPIAPVGEAWLADPDTDWFTGGYLSVTLESGHTKHEVLTFMSAERQERVREVQLKDADCPYGVADFPLLTVRDDAMIVFRKTLEDGEEKEVVVGKLLLPRCPSWAPSNNLRVDFTKEEEVVSLQLATYVMNCIEYDHAALGGDRPPITSRMFQIAINDGTNPAVGKGKVTVDVATPIVLPPAGLARAMKPPYAYTDEVAAALNTPTPVLQKAVVNWISSYDHHRGLTCTTANIGDATVNGFLTVAIEEGYKTGDSLVMKKEPNSAVKRDVAPERLHYEFAGSKTKVRDMGDIVRGISLKGAFAGTRKVKVIVYDGTQIPSWVWITVVVQ
eukprot:TRINITY_DN6440_c0_g3_i2.p1 TRINITY_DN6440_c0_g3~~TRINITY_DN6440_c0_g3_i2.p1  ORF type:complete len:2059 (+),score=684.69 TRINITY_DN6440_c0_g3_i2:32-6178(+)